MNNSLFQKFLSKMDQTLISQSEKSRKFSKNKIEKSVPLVKKPAGIVIRKNLPFAFEIMHIFKFFFLLWVEILMIENIKAEQENISSKGLNFKA